MHRIFIVFTALAVCACGNKNSANLSNSSVIQQNVGSGNQQSVNAVNASASQQQSGIANRQTMNLDNASGSQRQSGYGNSQSMTLHEGQSGTQNQAGIGNTQTFVGPCDKNVKVGGIVMSQAGILNHQTIRIGNQTSDGQSQSNKDCAKASAPN